MWLWKTESGRRLKIPQSGDERLNWGKKTPRIRGENAEWAFCMKGARSRVHWTLTKPWEVQGHVKRKSQSVVSKNQQWQKSWECVMMSRCLTRLPYASVSHQQGQRITCQRCLHAQLSSLTHFLRPGLDFGLQPLIFKWALVFSLSNSYKTLTNICFIIKVEPQYFEIQKGTFFKWKLHLLKVI